MSKSNHALKIEKNGVVYTCDLYTTPEEARSTLYPNYPLFHVNVDGVELYAPFTSVLNSESESTPLISPILESSGDDTEYCVAQHSFFKISITTQPNEVITVNAGGETWTNGNKWLPYGTTWTAAVSPTFESPSTSNPVESSDHVESDGSVWTRVFHHNNPANNLFASTDSFTTNSNTSTNKQFNVSLCNKTGQFELMLIQKQTSDGTVEKYRWIQNVNPMVASYEDVDATDITKITSTGYTTPGTTYGGIYKCSNNSSQTEVRAYLLANNGTIGNWWGAIGSWTAYSGGIPGYNGKIITTGYIDLYLRVDNLYVYNVGTISPSSSGSLLSNNVNVTAGTATRKTFTLTKSATNASTNQTLTVTYLQINEDGTFPNTSWSTLSSGSVTLRYGSHWKATVTASTGYDAGAITNSGGDLSSLTRNVTVSIAAATLKTYTLTKSATNASTNQTLTVKYAKATSSSAWGTTTTLSSGSVTLTHFSKWWGTVTASTGYTAGAVTNPGGDSSRMSGNVTVSVAAAKINTYVLRFGSGLTVKKTNSSGASISSGSSVNYNQVIWVQTTSTYKTYSIKLYKNSSASGTVWQTKTARSFTFNMPTSQVYIQNASTK